MVALELLFFFQAEDGIRDVAVTGVQTCALPISKRVTMALGLDAKRLREQWKAIDAWNASSRGFTILRSVELDILENGKLDAPEDGEAATRGVPGVEIGRAHV